MVAVEHRLSTAEVSLSKVPNPQIITLGPGLDTTAGNSFKDVPCL